jgi:hypothetical protein
MGRDRYGKIAPKEAIYMRDAEDDYLLGRLLKRCIARIGTSEKNLDLTDCILWYALLILDGTGVAIGRFWADGLRDRVYGVKNTR